MSAQTNGHVPQNLLELSGVTAAAMGRSRSAQYQPDGSTFLGGSRSGDQMAPARRRFSGTATGLVKPNEGQILLDGENVTGSAPHALARRGFCLVPEGRGIFPSLSVRENLILACTKRKDARDDAIDRTVEVLPALRGRLRQIAGSMSGGEQQMLALARAMMNDARLARSTRHRSVFLLSSSAMCTKFWSASSPREPR